MPLIVIALLTLGLCGGCALRVKNACDMNRSLSYVGWSADACECPAPHENTINRLIYVKLRSEKDREPPAEREIRVRPGMRLTFHTTPLRPNETLNENGTQKDKGQNAVTPPISKYEWIVPGDRLTPDDYFVIGYLLATSFRDVNLNDVVKLQSIGTALGADDFYKSINEKLYRKVIESLRYAPNSRPSAGLCPDASLLRQSVAEPTREDFLGPNTNAQLIFHLNDTSFRFGRESPTSYFNRDVPTTSGPPPSPWFQPDSARGRVLVTVDIPIRILSEPVSRYVPVYTSVADLEEQLGVEILGIRRSREFFGTIEVEGLLFGAKREDVISDDDYFTIWFDRWRGWALHESTHSLVAKNAKSTALLAPGDVIVIRTNRRNRATDDQAVR